MRSADSRTRVAALLPPIVALLLLAASATSTFATPRGKRPPRRLPELSRSGAAAVTELAATGKDGVRRPGPQCRPGRDTLNYHGGDLVKNPDVFLIFWGPQWQSDPQHTAAAAALIAMYQQLGTSGFACAWREYGVAGSPLGAGTYGGSEIIPTAPPSPLRDAVIQQRIVTEVLAGRAPARTDDRAYVVVPPDGVPVEASDGSTGCGGADFQFCGYHDSFAAGGRFRYAVLPFPCSTGFGSCFVDPTESPGRALQVVGSHELTELVTDPDAQPVGADGWFSDRSGMENADICASDACAAQLTVGTQTFDINPGWSDLAGGCVATVPCDPLPAACTDAAPGLCTVGTARATPCALEWLVDPNLTLDGAGMPGHTVRCADGQPFCDADGAQDGQCTFRVAACLNSRDPRISCTAASISSVHLSRPSPASSDQTNSGNATILLTALAAADPGATGTVSGARIAFSPAAGSADSCTSFLEVKVPVRSRGARRFRGRRRIDVTLQTASGRARNRLTLVCNPDVP